MKKNLIFLIGILIYIIQTLLINPSITQSLSNDTLLIPFSEDWSSGSFTTHNWSFPDGQGSWAIANNSGNPLPSAFFSGSPGFTNYSFVLSTPFMDGRELQSSTIWLDFDIKITVSSPTGSEKLIVKKFTNPDWNPVFTVKNDSSTGWKHFHLPVPSVNRHFFKIGFFATGSNSSNIVSWEIDNIQLNFICNPPRNLTDSVHQDTVFLSWITPDCGKGLIDLIYDDGTAESGWAINPDYNGWLGNEFPVSPMTGVIKSFTLFMYTNTCPQPVTIDVFDANHNLIATTLPFTPIDNNWETIPVNDFPFIGNFFAMIHYDHQCSEWLSDDENGSYVLEDLAWYYNDTTWQKLSDASGTAPKVFLLRATVYVNDSKKMVVLSPGQEKSNAIIVNDSMVITGYNVYRKTNGPYVKLNATPVQSTHYEDIPGTIDACSYYVDAGYNLASTNAFLCTSEGSDIVNVLLTDIKEKTEEARLKVFPVPASHILTLSSKFLIYNYEISNLFGSTLLSDSNLRISIIDVNIDQVPPGFYFLKVTTGQGIIKKKILINR